MINQERILTNIASIFGDGEEAFAAECIFNYINSRDTSHINLEFVRQLGVQNGGRRLNDNSILRALQYLSGDAVQALETCFEIEIGDGDFEDLTSEQAKNALLNLIDPISGHHDENLLSRILIFYRPTPSLIASKGAKE